MKPEVLPQLQYTDETSFGTHHRCARVHDFTSMDSRTCTAFSRQCHSYTDDPACSSPKPAIGLSATETISECTCCLSEPAVAGCCPVLASADKRQSPSACIDSCYDEAMCEEFYNHKECCDDCDVDSGSDCGILCGYDELDTRVDDTYSFEGSHFELFGDQTAQIFGFGRGLSQLAMANAIIGSSTFGKFSDDTTLSPLSEYDANQSYPGLNLPNPSSQTPWAAHTLVKLPQANTSRSSKLTSAHVSTLASNTATDIYSSDSAHNSSDGIDLIWSAHHDYINLLNDRNDPTRPFPPSLRCPWADSNREPCGKTLELGNDMHEHLKSAHSVKREVFCRWLGSFVGVLEPYSHRFACSAERHT